MAGYERPDYWTLRAKKEGYPARSVYKLEEIVRKFGLLNGLGGRRGTPERSQTGAGPAILDVGAAPGSWSLWLLRQMKGRGTLMAVDIQDLDIVPQIEAMGLHKATGTTKVDEPIGAHFTFVKGSILDEPVRARLRELGPYNLVVSDAAPATSGNRLVDQARSEELVEAVIGLALGVLAPGGALVTKIFQGGEERRLLTELRVHFAQARAFKPQACRSESFETYLVATGF
ncbi:MAG TPA: RlmE family RNA methyltransferase, partial [Rectinema sp.]|nr:RlmE family RNA methyltransferase [Rectinema sp.]